MKHKHTDTDNWCDADMETWSHVLVLDTPSITTHKCRCY